MDVLNSKIFIALVYLALGIVGIFLIINPSFGIQIFQLYAGVILTVAGLSYIYVYNRDDKVDTFQLVTGVVLTVIGVCLLISITFSMVVLGIILMVWLLFEGAMNIRRAIIYKDAKITGWAVLLVYGVILIAFGIYVLFNLSLSSTALIQALGVILVGMAIVAFLDLFVYNGRLMNNPDDHVDD